MKIAICDDSPDDLQLLLRYCKQYDSSLSIHTFSSGQALIDSYSLDFYNLVFLDIEMDPPNGYDTAVYLRTMIRKPEIIFTTKNLNYSIRGYGIALQYLPKPISYEMFIRALHQALQIITPPKISIPYQGTQKVIRISEIIYIEVIRHQVLLHMANNICLEFRGSLKEVIEQINSSWFVQCHKSYCVNLRYIDRTTSQSIVMENQDVVPIGRNKKLHFENRLQEYLRGSML